MMGLEQEWQTFLRQHRLPLVTSVREEIVELLTSLVPIHVEDKNRTLTFSALNEKNQPLRIRFQLIFGSLQVKLWRDDKILLISATVSTLIEYKNDYIPRDESRLLRKFLISWYNWCLEMTKKGENKYDVTK